MPASQPCQGELSPFRAYSTTLYRNRDIFYFFYHLGLTYMAILNLQKREIECKIVYYGPGRCGKTTNLEHIFKTYKKQITGDMVSVDTEGDRTLFFDFLPMGLGKIKGCEVSWF